MNKIIELTNREIDVLKKIIEGKSNNEIANALCISTHTVKAHIENMYQKFGVHNKVQLVVHILSNESKIKI